MTPLGFSPEDEYEDIVQSGIIEAQYGDPQVARKLLERATRIKTGDPRPWVWLAETTDDYDEKLNYLEEAVAAEPHNTGARQKLALLTGKIKSEDMLPEGVGVTPRASDAPISAQTQRNFACPQCGGRVTFNIQTQKVQCAYCGYEREVTGQQAADIAEQVLDFVLPTHRGHHWAESQRQLSCQRCGAVSLWPVGQRATHCPYCGSNQLIETSETPNLVDPQVIGVMEIEKKEAVERINTWLGKGWFAPDDLSTSAKQTRLHSAYYPFWTFDGTLEVHWRCEVQEGYGRNAQWVARTGIEFEMFDDVLISGNESLSTKTITEIEPFKLKEVVEFKPEYLAGWPALTYDTPLAKASLLARKRVIKKVRRNLHAKVVPNKQKRGLQTGGVHWMDMTFKHVLLPLWIGSYWYKGKRYQVLINGQTGKINGEKPRDTAKTAGIVLSIFFTVLVVFIFLAILAIEMGWITLR
ncbi:MAG: hypothetical protein DRI56_10785 [Chloroflexota bacterium]|nr:MAG: hypothetical protein DRI56_10785 [Chloroflexota bacterium]